MRANRKDLVHNELTDIIKELRDKHSAPIDFTDVHMIKGFCDVIVTFGTGQKGNYINQSFGRALLVEIKSKGGVVTDGEAKYIRKTFGDYLVVYSFEELLDGMKLASTTLEELNIAELIEDIYYNKILKKESPSQWSMGIKAKQKISFE